MSLLGASPSARARRESEGDLVKYWRKPLDLDQIKIPRGAVRIVVDRCKGCGFCVEYCPKDVLVMSVKFNRKGYHPPEVVANGECVNCNLCEMICPEFAIYSVLLPDAETAAATEDLPREANPHETDEQQRRAVS
jgi:2-oxoglutarate ferredoxin oxidoreductase subunit delta